MVLANEDCDRQTWLLDCLGKQSSTRRGPLEAGAAHPLGNLFQRRGRSYRMTEDTVVTLERIEPGVLVHF
jgi:hypothetical protein